MQKLTLFFTLLLTISCFGTAQQSNILVDAEWLSNRFKQDDIVVLHIGREDDFQKEHIPGAVYISSRAYTYDDESQNIVFDRPEDAVLKEIFESRGISNSTDVVIYTPGPWIPLVTRLYWTLDYLGHGNKTYILDGGLVAWKAAGFFTSDIEAVPQKGNFKLKPSGTLLADTNHMKASIENKRNSIIDCRSEVYYNGIESTHGARSGRIPSAKNIPYTSLYEASDIGAYKFKSLNDLESIFSSRGLDKDEPIVLYCHIGMQLTVVYTAAKMLGYRNIKMYDPSFNVWGKDESLPVELN